MNQFKLLDAELRLRNYSEKTIKAYLYHNQRFLDWIKKSPREINQKDIENYCLSLNKLDAHTKHLIVASLRFYYHEILKRRFRFKYPKTEKHLPLVISKEKILQMINLTKNLKHKLVIILMYSSGLRVGELVKVKINDINIENKTLIVKQGKGRKDRLVILSEIFINYFNDFVKKSDYLFYSERNSKKHISVRTAQKIIENAAAKAGIKHIYCHALRASFATHLLEKGIDVLLIQKLMGHSNLSTTQGYIKLRTDAIKNIKSPLDY